MKVISGILIFSVGTYYSIQHLGQSIVQYWDAVAFFMVISGTISVAIMTLPSLSLKIILRELFLSMESFSLRRRKTILNGIDILDGNKLSFQSGRIDYKIMLDGLELISLGIPSEKIESILKSKVINYTEDCMGVANWLRSLAKYPPAFGLSGTIFGLTQIMRSLAEGADARETGLGMAIALVATLYGILTANFLVSPLGERIKNNKEENEVLCEIAIKAIVMKSDGTNPLVAKESIGSYLISDHKKLNPIDNRIMRI